MEEIKQEEVLTPVEPVVEPVNVPVEPAQEDVKEEDSASVGEEAAAEVSE